MACIHSKPAWRTGLPNERGKYPLRFKMRKDTPDYFIGCGKCDGCAAQKSLEWSIRIYHESMCHERNCFVTLTYADAPDEINRNDPQDFIKRLRYYSDNPIRYFLCGEYGEKTKRPHYHAIIFGEDFLGGAYDIDTKLYGNVLLDRIWKHGKCAVSEFSLATAMYTAGYVNKKIDDPLTFSIMSRKPPLGREWLKRNHDNIRRNKNVVISGQEFPVPGVYFKWLDGVEEFDAIKEEKGKKNVPLTDRQSLAKGLHLKSRRNLKAESI